MKNLRFLSLFVILLLASCSITKMQDSGAVEPKNFSIKIPFETYKSVIVCNVKINGVIKKFLFDTGADLTLVQREEMKGKTAKYSGASKRKMELGEEVVPQMQIGTTKFLDIHAINGDLIGLKEQIPLFGGLIGQSIIRKANWLIDYPNKSLEISTENLIDDSFQEIKSVKKGGNSPYTFIEVNGKKYKVLIDTGSSSTLNIPKDSKFAKEVAKITTLSTSTRERYTLGGVQTIREQVGTLPKVKIGNFELENIDFNINTSSQARVGISFFKDFVIYIDNDNGGVYKLKKN